MTVLRIKPRTAQRFFPDIQERLSDLSPAKRAMYRHMRVGRGSVRQQFDAEAEFTSRGRRPWKPSRRALIFPKGGGTNKTLRDTTAYYRAWIGGSGATQRFTRTSKGARFRIGVDRNQFPQEATFQATRARRIRRGSGSFSVEPRRVGVGRAMLAGARDVVTDWVVRGRR